MKAWILLLSLCSALSASAIDKPIFGTREDVVSALGDASEPVEGARAALPGSEVRRYRKDGWIVVVYFGDARSYRVIINKEDSTRLTDQEIKSFLSPYRSGWERWKLPGKRAWLNNVKAAMPKYALVSNDDKTLDLIDDLYLHQLGKQTWLDSIEPKK